MTGYGGGPLSVDPVREGERRGIRAVLDVLTQPVDGDPSRLRFTIPQRSVLDEAALMADVERALATARRWANANNPEMVTLRCPGGCEPGSYVDGPPAPQEDCPVHGRSYDDMWLLRGAYEEALAERTHGPEIRERAMAIYHQKWQQEQERRQRRSEEGGTHG